jgi:hypothetical protein
MKRLTEDAPCNSTAGVVTTSGNDSTNPGAPILGQKVRKRRKLLDYLSTKLLQRRAPT